jgi:glyoxylase-like metal-dependent hydrolase (beta-lactamase superfamily II)
VPVYAVAGVNETIRRDDEAKEQILRPMFGSEWAATRIFPNHIVRGDERVTIGGATFAVTDLGPGESPHDSLWRLEAGGARHAFVGDLVYSHMHAYLADGFHDQWLANLQRTKRELPEDIALFMGHGRPTTGKALLDWEMHYIGRFVEVLRAADDLGRLQGDALASAVTTGMKAFLPCDDLLFLMQLSIEPVRARLAAAQA